MTNTEMTTRPEMPRPELPRPEMHWVPVTDDAGRTHMEAVWVDAGRPTTVHAAA